MSIKGSLLLPVVFVSLFSSLPLQTVSAQDKLLGELYLFGGNFCPRNSSEAAGQLLAISSNTALFSIFGTIYGGDGRTTFGLPDLRGRAPIGQGTGPALANYQQGASGGAENIQLSVQNMPAHSHSVVATNTIADKTGPGGKYLAAKPLGDPLTMYTKEPLTTENTRIMGSQMISNSGASLPLLQRSPYLTLRWCVVTAGIFPSRN